MIGKLRASVQPVVTYAFVALLGYALLTKMIGSQELGPLAGTVIGFWFATREKKKEES